MHHIFLNLFSLSFSRSFFPLPQSLGWGGRNVARVLSFLLVAFLWIFHPT